MLKNQTNPKKVDSCHYSEVKNNNKRSYKNLTKIYNLKTMTNMLKKTK